MNISTLEETQTPLDIETIERTTFVNDQINSFYAQDQIDLLPQVKLNIAGRVDDYERNVDRVGGNPFTPVHRDQTAFSYRAGIVYAPRYDQQIYFATSSSFTPVNTVPRRRFPTRSQHRAQLRGGSSLAGMERPRGHEPRRVSHHPQQRDGAGVGHDGSVRSASRRRQGSTWTSTRIWAGGRI